MSRLGDLHSEAMAVADAAMVARVRGEDAGALLRRAFALEAEAARLARQIAAEEPTLSVLHRSAASLAMECGEYRDAERLIGAALMGDPPSMIAEELRDLLEQVHFARHLELRGVVLDSNEFQVSIAGNAVGYGVAGSEVFLSRVRDLEKLVVRTAERRLRRPFREHGPTAGAVGKAVEMFVSAPRAASLALSIRIGHSTQLALPGTRLGDVVVQDLLDCLELYNRGNARGLSERIGDAAYYRNFVSLAKSLAPDGHSISVVGFTAASPEGERRVLLDNPEARQTEVFTASGAPEAEEHVRVRGTLKLADALREDERFITVVDENGRKHRVRVPTGLMDDIVRPLWESVVDVSGIKRGRVIDLLSIAKVDT